MKHSKMNPIKQLIVGTILSAVTLTSALAVPAAPTGTHGSLPANSFGGTGIPTDDVMTATSGGLTLGLSAHERFVGPLASDGAGTFFAPTGESSPGLAKWNFNFYLNNTGIGGLAAYSYKLSYGTDASGLVSFSPLLITDNSPLGSLTTAGNSENLGFNFGIGGLLGPAIGFNPMANADYAFILSAYSLTDVNQTTAIATTAINVRVGTGDPSSVPDAGSTLALAGLAMTGIVGLRRKLTA